MKALALGSQGAVRLGWGLKTFTDKPCEDILQFGRHTFCLFQVTFATTNNDAVIFSQFHTSPRGAIVNGVNRI